MTLPVRRAAPPPPGARRAAALFALAALAGASGCESGSAGRRVAIPAGDPATDERPARVELVLAPDSATPAPPVDSATADSIAAERAKWPTTVIRFQRAEAAPVSLWAGDTLQLPTPEPPAGTPADIARDVRWSSEEPGVATVSRDGTVVGVRPGSTVIVAWRRVGQVATPVTVRPASRGRVLLADGGADGTREGVVPDAVLAVLPDVGLHDSVRTDAQGRFAWRARYYVGRSAEMALVPVGTLADHYFAARFGRVPVEHMLNGSAVLVPRRWRIRTGSYAGTTVAIAPAAALARLRDGSRFWRLTRANPAGGVGRPIGWPERRFPIPVALDLGDGGHAADSAAFWAAARQLERDWGSPLFVPAPAARARDDDWRGIVVEIDPRIPAAGFTTTTSDGEGDISIAEIAFRTRADLRDPGIATHELMHALGLGHTERQESVMRVSGALPSRASAEDVAYGRLFYAVRALQARWGAEYGLGEIADY